MRVNYDGRSFIQRILAGFPRFGEGEDQVIAGPEGPAGPPGPAVTGVIEIWGGDQAGIPDGYLLCDGSAVSRTTYAALFAKIKTYYGSGDGVNTFNLPNFIGRFPLGSNGTMTGIGYVPGGAAGTSQHDHGVTGSVDIESTTVAHTHSLTISAGGQHNHDSHGSQSNIAAQGSNTVLNSPTGSHSGDGSHDHGGAQSLGGMSVNDPHDHVASGTTASVGHMPPYLAVLYIIKT